MKALFTAIAFAAVVAPTVAHAGPEFNVNKFDKGPSWSSAPAANTTITPDTSVPVAQPQWETPIAAGFTMVDLTQGMDKSFIVRPMIDDVPPATDVPEPAQAALVLAALMAFGLSRRRSSKR